MRRCLITFCPANHKMNRMVMVITEDSDLITVTPQGDGNHAGFLCSAVHYQI